MSTQLKLIKRTPDLSTNAFSSFLAMYKSYIEELSAFSQRLRDEPVSIMEVCDIWNNPDVELYFVMHDDEPAGFIVLGINANKHESSDWFIGEFYIKKNLQSKGIGKSAVKSLLREKKGKYCFFVLKNNIRARAFWKKAFSENQYIDTTCLYKCSHTPNDCIFKMFSPRDGI